VDGSRIRFGAFLVFLKSNMPLSVPAFASKESSPMRPRSQLSSINRSIEDWSVKL
jgi:hypothetical protein